MMKWLYSNPKWLYSNPKSEKMNFEEVSVEYANLIDKKKKSVK